MSIRSNKNIHRILRLFLTVCIAISSSYSLKAQSLTDDKDIAPVVTPIYSVDDEPAPPQTSPSNSQQSASNISPVPVLTGAIAFVPIIDTGHFTQVTVFAPVLLIPLGEKWLVESRVTFEGDFTHDENNYFGGAVDKEIDYAQLDYIANPFLTISVGRFLTPFGIYNERLYPRWIRNLQTEPFILPLEEDSGNGVMVRGSAKAGSDVNVLYAASFSAMSNINYLESDRQVGGRFGFFFPNERLEVGFSYKHFLQDDHSNLYGAHLIWQPLSKPFDLRAEYANGAAGHGYWVEPAYRLSDIPVAQSFFRKVQLTARMQQFFVKQGNDPDLPSVNMQQIEGGVNYYFRDDLRAVASIGRHFSSQGDGTVWTVGLTYRFAIPLGNPR